MPHSSPPDQEPQPHFHRWRLMLLRAALISGGVTLAAGAIGAWWAWTFIQERLAPLVETNLSQTLNRPLDLGEVEQVTLTGLRFGESILPPTANDRDRVTVDAVEVSFNLWDVIWTRRLGLDITLLRPDIFVDQTPDGRWISTQVTTQDSRGIIKTELDTIRFRQATLTLEPSPAVSAEANEPGATARTITLQNVNGSANLQNQNQKIFFEANGAIATGGSLTLKGETDRTIDRTRVSIQGENLQAADVSALLPLPIRLQAGQVGGNLTIDYQPDNPIAVNGTVQGQGVSAKIAEVPNEFRQVAGRLRFVDQRIFFEELSGLYGEIPAELSGSLDFEEGYDLRAQAASVTVPNLLRTFNLKTPIALSGVFQGDVRITGEIDRPLLTGTARSIRSAQADRLRFDRLTTNFRVTPQALTFDQITAVPSGGGVVQGSGTIGFRDETVAFRFNTTNAPGDAIARSYGFNNPNVRLGAIAATASVEGTFSNFQTNVRFQALQATYPTTGEAQIRGSNVRFRNTEIRVAGGRILGEGEVANGRWNANGQIAQVPLNQFRSNLSGALNGDFQLAGTLTNFSPDTIRGSSNFRIDNFAGGRIVGQGTIANGRWNAVASASQVALNRFNPSLASGSLGGNFRVAGRLSDFSPNAIQAQGQYQIANLAGGRVAGNVAIASGLWNATVQASNVALAAFSPNLRGELGSNLRVSGTLANPSLATIRAAGQVQLSQGLAQIDRPLTASIRWLGDRLQIDSATAPGLRANGVVFVATQTPAISRFDINLGLQDYNLADLPVTLPNNVQVAGLADFQGRISGTPSAPAAIGQLALQNLVVNNSLAFEDRLAGSVRYGGQTSVVDLRGDRDRIYAQLDSRNRPIEFLIQQDTTIAQGRTVGDRLIASVANFPLDVLNLRPVATLGTIGGTLNGDFNVNLNTFAAEGRVAIAQPRLGYLNAIQEESTPDSLVAEFRYANGAGVISNGELRFNNSRYLLAGNFSGGNDPQFQGKITADQGRIEDILTALQFFDYEDFGRGLELPTYDSADALDLVPVGSPGAALITQLRRLAEIDVLRAQRQQQEDAQILPDLATLNGAFTGEIDIAASARSGIIASFNLEGQDWRYGEYGVDRVILADGTFENGELTVLPLRLQGFSYLEAGDRVENPDSFLSFSGSVGGEAQSGQLQAQQVPAALVRDFFDTPLDVDGQINATATVSGSFRNPQATGEFSLAEGSLNGTPVQEATSFFSYNDARLNFEGRVVVEEPQPLTIAGSLPYRFPFMTVFPDSDAISLDVNVQDEGLALLNLFQNQVAWEGGEGSVNLQVRGTALNPIAEGTARFENATFTAQALPEPLTNASGRIQFNRSRIQVEAFRGDIGSGFVTAIGVLPIFDPNDAPTSDTVSPLIVKLNDLTLNYKGLYNGNVSGEVNIAGAALAPLIGGNITLSQGRVSLPDTAAPATTETPTAEANAPLFTAPALNNLQITLGDALLITRQPVLNFLARGDLLVNGSLDNFRDLEANGTIELRGGQVNLFTTQFNLDRRFPQTATFTPNQGLDPELNITLVTSVPEVTSTPTQITSFTPFASSEVSAIPASEFGSLQTVRVQARVTGRASQLGRNLELSSSPGRSQNEILALIGGSFVDTLGRGDTTLALANLAGSALLTRVQNFIGNTLGLSEFRLFPTSITNDEGQANFGLAAEIGVDITPNLSASVLQFLTTPEPTQVGLRYRLSDEFLLRSSTNFSGESRVVLEFNRRF
ncbi:translocation/assembly module TamB domain-containing protein [Microcoleus sp. FACHB-1515]|uniref:translocation/assembly module TamB domain-containing protein n=1 Tax=Cyanophyceae TaxID=3028117 RepID=UPI001682DBD3|nr:translocation/assembly module TamB [Microcoleus sp. FACHB-1515]MBD2090888.1 translocation/assembly module TamB domain-containing protein [Microcoleus sp. FACHB-1515]